MRNKDGSALRPDATHDRRLASNARTEFRVTPPALLLVMLLGVLCWSGVGQSAGVAPAGRPGRLPLLAGAQFRQALPGYRFDFPRDHFAHPDFQTEWWYYTGNLQARDGRRFGFELTFFRQAVEAAAKAGPAGTSPWDVRDIYLAHFALSDIDGKAFHQDGRVNRAGPGLAGVDASSGLIWNGNWTSRISADRHDLEAIAERYAMALVLRSRKPPVIQGVGGVSQKAAGAGQASHYVSMTRLVATGAIDIDGRRIDVEGSAWMDHEFFTNQLGRDQRGWDWLGLQLDDGSELMVYRLRRADGTADPFSAGTVVEADGRATHLRAEDFAMSPAGDTWTSPASRATYPIAWRITVPARALDLGIRTPLASQELPGRRGFTPTYWEGSVSASGTRAGARIAGVGYLEMTGYDKAVVLGGRQ
jgi:predicted secreted hydrolase